MSVKSSAVAALGSLVTVKIRFALTAPLLLKLKVPSLVIVCLGVTVLAAVNHAKRKALVEGLPKVH